MKGGEDELSEKAGVACTGCEGECSSLGELLASDERSDEALWIETICTDPLSVPLFPGVRSDVLTQARTAETGGGLGEASASRAGSGGSTHVALGQQAGAELHVVLQVEGAAGLELGAEDGEVQGVGHVPHAALLAELLLLVLRHGEPGCPPVAAAVVAVAVYRRGRRRGVVLLVAMVVVV